MKKRKLWIVTFVFAFSSYLFFAQIFPAMFSLIPTGVQVEGAQEPVRDAVRWPFQLVGLVAAGVILIQPLIAKLRK